jgi:hypothetical protein
MPRSAPSIPMPARAAERRTSWALSGLPESTARGLERWLDSLGELTLAEWTRIGEQCMTRDQAMLAMTRACTRVEKAIATQELGVTAWLVRDMVETATFRVRQHAARRPRRVRSQIAVARMAAEWAALAIMTQQFIGATDLDTFCAPFERPAKVGESASA